MWRLPWMHRSLCWFCDAMVSVVVSQDEPRHVKTCLQGYLPGLTQTLLCNHRRWLHVWISGWGSRGIVLCMLQKQRRWSAARLPCSWSAALFSHISHMQAAYFVMTWLKIIIHDEWAWAQDNLSSGFLDQAGITAACEAKEANYRKSP